MKKIIPITLTLLLAFFATTALAERGHGRGNQDYYSTQGDRIDRHLDRLGNRIESRFEHKAGRAEAKGQYRQAQNFRAKGKQINRHLHHKGNWIRTRYSQYRPHNSCDHRVAYVQPRFTYRSHTPDNNRFGVVINQPGLWFGGSWHD